MAKEIEEKIYTALGVDRDLVTPIERDAMPPAPDDEAEMAEAA